MSELSRVRVAIPRLLLGVALCAAACTTTDDRPATWAFISTAILQPRCGTAGCHSELAQTDGVILDSRAAGYRTLITMPADGYGSWVAPGDPTRSQLLYILRGREVPRMPPDAPLPLADIELIEQWIADGAEDN